MYHPQSDVDRLFPRKDGGRGLLSIVECVESEEESLGRFEEECEDRLVKCVKEEGLLPSVQGSAAALKKKRKEKGQIEWKEKSPHGKNDSRDSGYYECKVLVLDTESLRVFEEGNRRNDIHSTRTSTPNKLGKEEHWQEGCEWKMPYVWGAWRIHFSLILWMQKASSARLQTAPW